MASVAEESAELDTAKKLRVYALTCSEGGHVELTITREGALDLARLLELGDQIGDEARELDELRAARRASQRWVRVMAVAWSVVTAMWFVLVLLLLVGWP